MAHIVSGKLRKAPFIKEGCGQGDSTMFVIELAEMNKDWQTQEKSYTNYKAMFFAKTDAAKGYYHKAFAEGSFVVVQCEKLKVDTFQADSGVTYVTLNMENARLEGALTIEDQGGMPQQPQQQYNAPQQQQVPQQQYQQQPQQQAQPQYNNPPQDFDDSQIPF
ncbi:nucleic acid-binding, OB-fold protein [Vibrio phage 1.284.A._10N.286.55.A5]|nr:nucleic acid-binding, OB-fold protein [Vibrio phage 1.284.A._10N.286.55.A5]